MLNNLFKNDSSDSGDLADQLDHFFRFMGWNKNKIKVLVMRDWKFLSPLHGCDEYPPQASVTRVKFFPSATAKSDSEPRLVRSKACFDYPTEVEFLDS